ncbi:MAG: NAD(P)-dependent oxidoreductase [Verrucomicrobia bacterium]|jgi:L-threonate 2-dehydrogenase|nr:NAD(P)-dependent oxidoreductase [Verrucomicrobiota bacterium]
MKKVGFIGLGDMGMAMAKNLLKEGFDLTGFDLREEQLLELEAAGGKRASSPSEMGAIVDVVFIMVMTGKQVDSIITGKDGLLETMSAGKTIILTATIEPPEARAVCIPVFEKGIEMIDSPVSGGKGGAEGGTLAMMAAGKREVWEAQQDVMNAVGGNIFHVGEEVGKGQTVKASLQALIGSTFTAIFESLVLGSKAGIEGKVLYEVFSASGVSSPLFKNCAGLIMDRKFKGTGSQIKTMHKDLGITMAMAKENGAAMFTTSAAYELFQSGISMFPEEDNWSIVKLLEQIAGTEVKW